MYLDEIERAALGRRAELGFLYNSLEDRFIRSSILLQHEEIEKVKTKTDKKYQLETSWTTEETFSKRLKGLEIPADQALGLLSGLHEDGLEGHEDLIKWEKKTNKVIRGTFVYKVLAYEEKCEFSKFHRDALIMEAPGGYLSRSTHVVSGIKWGARVVVSFDCRIPFESERHKTEDLLKKFLRQFQENVTDLAPLRAKLGEYQQLDLAIEIDGDVGQDSAIKLDSLSDFIDDRFPKLVKLVSTSTPRPFHYRMFPISKIPGIVSNELFLRTFLASRYMKLPSIEYYFSAISKAQYEMKDFIEDITKNNESKLIPKSFKVNGIISYEKKIGAKIAEQKRNFKTLVFNYRSAGSESGWNTFDKLTDRFPVKEANSVLNEYKSLRIALQHLSEFRDLKCSLLRDEKDLKDIKRRYEDVFVLFYVTENDVFESGRWKLNRTLFCQTLNLAATNDNIRVFAMEEKASFKIPFFSSSQVKVRFAHYYQGKEENNDLFSERGERFLTLMSRKLCDGTPSVKIDIESESISKTNTKDNSIIANEKCDSARATGNTESSFNLSDFGETDYETKNGTDSNYAQSSTQPAEKGETENVISSTNCSATGPDNKTDVVESGEEYPQVFGLGNKHKVEGTTRRKDHVQQSNPKMTDTTYSVESKKKDNDSYRENSNQVSDVTSTQINSFDNTSESHPLQKSTDGQTFESQVQESDLNFEKPTIGIETQKPADDEKQTFKSQIQINLEKPSIGIETQKPAEDEKRDPSPLRSNTKLEQKMENDVTATNGQKPSNAEQNATKSKKQNKNSRNKNGKNTSKSVKSSLIKADRDPLRESEAEKEISNPIASLFVEESSADIDTKTTEEIPVSCSAKPSHPFETVSEFRKADASLLEIVCPSSLYGKCQLNGVHVFRCEICSQELFYGFDKDIYCENCGKAPAISFSFKCTHPTHGDDYFQFEKGDDLLSMLEKLKKRQELNILILGETGVGKSTFINAFANYLTYATLDEAERSELIGLIPTSFTLSDENYDVIEVKFGDEDRNEANEEGASKTQSCKAYCFPCGEKWVRLIDTPGIGDTRGIDQDAKNFVNILGFISNYSSIHGILLLMKPNNSRLNIFFRFCIQELLNHLHKSASENITFVFTNAKSTFYKPGDTFSPLKKLLGQLNDVRITLNQETIYCLDNDAFRFLVALRNRVSFQEGDREEYSFSWDKSVSECDRLLKRIDQLKPHCVKETLSINEARRLITSLVQPLGDIVMVIQENLLHLNSQIEHLQSSKNNLQKLKQNLFVPVVDAQFVPLQHPRTVCKSERCVNKEDENVEKVCHDPCYLSNITPDVINNRELERCLVFKSGLCGECGCSWKEHIHQRYLIEKTRVRKMDQSKASEINNWRTRQEKAEEMKQELEKQREGYINELDFVVKASAMFSNFLTSNSITHQSDSILAYLDFLIEKEKSKRKLANFDLVSELEKLKTAYIQQLRSLAQNPSECNAQAVEVHASMLFSLPIFGASSDLVSELEKVKTAYLQQLRSIGRNPSECDAQAVEVHSNMLFSLPIFGARFKWLSEQHERAVAQEMAAHSERVYVPKNGAGRFHLDK